MKWNTLAVIAASARAGTDGQAAISWQNTIKCTARDAESGSA